MLSLIAALAMTVEPALVPDIPRGMLEAAAKTGEIAQVEAVAAAAAEVFPDSSDIIAQYAGDLISGLPQPDPEPEAAEEPSQPTEGFFAFGEWTGAVTAAAVTSSGNSENLAVGGAFNAEKVAGKLTHGFNGYIDFGRSAGVQNQKRWGASYQLDYALDDRTYAYSRLAFDEDEFSGFDYRLFAGLGLGHFLYKSEPFTWKIEGGPGFQYSPIDDTRDVQEELAVYASSETDWIIREGLKFEQNFAVTWTDPTTTFLSVTSLTTALTKTLATGVSFEYRYETSPPLGRQNTDTVLRANLSYGF